MPKSGSSFLADVISQIDGFKRSIPIPSGLRREQELDEFYLQQVDDTDYVAQLHVRHSDWTEQMCLDYGLKPVVLVRNLFDVVVSLRDHLRRESHIWPMIWLEPPHADLDDGTLERMIARLAVPWYINFYMSWRAVPHAMLLSYEELMADPLKATKDVMSFAGASLPEDRISKAVDFVGGAGASRLNVGISGRGNALQPDTVRGILELIDFYPEASNDPYVRALQEQGKAILAGAAAPPSKALSQPRPLKTALPGGPRRPHRVRQYLLRFLVPAALASVAALYWLVPRDVVPDMQAWGRVDDAAVIFFLMFLAGRLTKYKVAIEDLRRRPDRQSVRRMLQRMDRRQT